MTNLLSRSRSDLILGFWALAPAIGLPLLVFAWVHRVNTFASRFADFDFNESAVPTWMLLAGFAVGALYLIALIAVINDIWARALPRNLQIMWTVLALLVAPYAGVAYWAVHCRRI